MSAGFLERIFGKPPEPPRGDPERIAAVQRLLAELEPLVAADGGAIELVAVERGRVDVRLEGACKSCVASESTLFDALEPKLRAALPWFSELRRV
jgi:Fe-S cluster biogenesis protein NfuA